MGPSSNFIFIFFPIADFEIPLMKCNLTNKKTVALVRENSLGGLLQINIFIILGTHRYVAGAMAQQIELYPYHLQLRDPITETLVSYFSARDVLT